MLRLHEYRYHRPSRLDEALDLLSREDAMAIAGGTDLVPNMKHRLWTPNHLVALKGVHELRGIGFVDGEVCHVTKVGTKCVAAHSADTPPVLITLGALVDLVSPAGVRALPVEDFFVADGEWNTVRRRGELVTRVRVPLPAAGLRTSYQKVRQRGSIDFPLLSIAVAAELEDDETVRELSIVVSALGARPRTISGIDRIARGRSLAEVTHAVALQAHRQARPLENIIVDPEWRRAMVPVHVRRALQEISRQA